MRFKPIFNELDQIGFSTVDKECLVHTVSVKPELIEFYSQTVTAYLVPHLLNVVFFHFPFPKGKKKDKRDMSIN